MGPVVHSLSRQYWSKTSGKSSTHYGTDFGSIDTGLEPVVHTLTLTSGQWRML